MENVCKICGNSENNTYYIVREMLCGFRDEFEYFQCEQCLCLQITEIPSNLEKYYPSNYYSYSEPWIPKLTPIKLFIKRLRLHSYLTGHGILGRTLLKLFGPPTLQDYPSLIKLLKDAGLQSDAKIIDIGCGSGKLLMAFYDVGFSRLTGIDPFVERGLYYENGVQIIKQSLNELDEKFDLMMLHHSFEHMPDPKETFKQFYEKTTDNGLVLIRIPTVSSFAWREYKTDWVQLDAPRHFYLYSIESIELLAKNSGFKIESIEFDSTIFQFYGSEQYRHDISLTDQRSYKRNNIEKSVFTENDIKNFEIRTAQLNLAKDGDQACFLLRKVLQK